MFQHPADEIPNRGLDLLRPETLLLAGIGALPSVGPQIVVVLCHRGFDEYVTLAVYRGENAGGIDVKKVYVVDLTKEEKSELLKLVGKGEVRARKMNRAHILLLADEDRTDKNIAKALHTSPSTVERTRRRLVEGGLEHALNESPRPGGRRKLTGKQEAYVVALACSDPPEGKKRWSMQMLADKLVELEVVGDGISDETVRRTLKRGMLSRG
jgi:transposase